MERIWIGLGALSGLLAVAMAASVAHLVTAPAAQALASRALQMHGWHALALLAAGLWAPRGGRLADLAGAAFAIGLPAFCGAVYALALRGLHFGPLAPIGGSLLMLGWLFLGASALRGPR